MFSGDEYSASGIMYRGISLAYEHPAALDEPCHMIPEELLDEIDARFVNFDIDHYLFLLPNAKSIISSKCEYSYIRICDIKDNGVLLELCIHTESEWDDLLSPEAIFLELQTELKKMANVDFDLINIDPVVPIYLLHYHLFVPSFNLKEAYEQANNLLIDLEKRVYKKILKLAIEKAIEVL